MIRTAARLSALSYRIGAVTAAPIGHSSCSSSTTWHVANRRRTRPLNTSWSYISLSDKTNSPSSKSWDVLTLRQ